MRIAQHRVSALHVGAWLMVMIPALSFLVRADDSSSRSISGERIASWIADLGSDSRAARSKAESALIEQGPAILESLPGEANLDPVVREGLDRIIRRIEENETQVALLPRTVKFPTGNLANCVELLERSTGNRVTCACEKIPDLPQLPTQSVTFWQAIQWIEKNSAVRYQDRHLISTEDMTELTPSHLQGVFRVQMRKHAIRSTASGQRLLGVQLGIECEPRMRPLFLIASIDQWKAKIGSHSLSPFTPGASRELTAGRNGETEVSYDFLVPSDVIAGQLSLTGEVRQTISARSSTVYFSDLQAPFPQVRRRGQATFTLLSMKSEREQTAFRVALAFPDSQGLFESYRSSLLTPVLSLQLADGRTLAPDETSQVQEDPDGNILEARFATREFQGARLVAQIPLAISSQPVAFEFDEIPLTFPKAVQQD